ncbi:MAG: GNAT family N-acetyltransferase [Sneathiellales bacterium]|nr:GNAT family N-acetyltransferase [Sneathiellales bacterium]
MSEISYRKAKDSDAEGLIALIDKCYQEYEGCILDVDAEEPQLRAIASYFDEKNGEFWVAEKGGVLIGSIGYTLEGRDAEIKHLYVDGDIRRQGLASTLCNFVDEALENRAECTRIILWTDTRFTNAHRLYEKRGFVGGKETRTLNDLSNTTEYYYEKPLRHS